MNNIQLLVKVEEIKKQLQPDNQIEVTGLLSFKFTERGEILVRQLPFLARNNTAESLVAGGVKAVYLASGRMRVYAAKPGDENANARLLYLMDSVYQTKQAQPKTEAVKHSASATPVAAFSQIEPPELEPVNQRSGACEPPRGARMSEATSDMLPLRVVHGGNHASSSTPIAHGGNPQDRVGSSWGDPKTGLAPQDYTRSERVPASSPDSVEELTAVSSQEELKTEEKELADIPF